MLIFLIFSTIYWESDGIIVREKRYDNLPYEVKTIDIENPVTASNISEFLEQELGIIVKEYGSPGMMSNPVIRSNSPGHTLIMLNGHRINDPKTGSFDLTSLPLNSIERVQLIKGPASVFSGSNAVGGIINFITEKKGSDIDIKVSSNPEVQFDLKKYYGNILSFFHLSKGSTSRSNSDYHRVSGSINLYDFRIFGTFRETGLPGPVPPENSIPTLGDSTATNLYNSQTTGFLDISYKKQINISEGGILLVPSLQIENLNPETRYQDFITGNLITENDIYKTFVIQLDTRLFLHKFELSLHLEQDKIDMEQNLSSGDTTSWKKDEFNAGISLSRDFDFSGIIFFTALRGDWYESFGFNPSYSAGIKLKHPFPSYLSAGTSFKAPTLNDLYWPGYSNENLEPEYSTGVNAGFRLNSFEVSTYWSRIKDRIGYGVDWKPYNIFETELYGFSLEYQFQKGPLSILSRFSYRDGYDLHDSTERELQLIPHFHLSEIINYSGPVKLDFSINWMGGKKKWFPNEGMWKKDDGKILIDIGISKDLGPIFLSLAVKNVFDSKHVSRFGNSYSDRDFPGRRRSFELKFSY